MLVNSHATTASIFDESICQDAFAFWRGHWIFFYSLDFTRSFHANVPRDRWIHIACITSWFIKFIRTTEFLKFVSIITSTISTDGSGLVRRSNSWHEKRSFQRASCCYSFLPCPKTWPKMCKKLQQVITSIDNGNNGINNYNSNGNDDNSNS